MRDRNFNKGRFGREKPMSGVITVTAEECAGNPDKMVRRFTKKVKNEGLLEEFRDRLHFTKPSDKKKVAKQKTKRMIEKADKKMEELLKPRDRRLKRSLNRRQ